MSRPLSDQERIEIDQLAFECEQSPARLRRYLLELIRLRNVIRIVRTSRLTPRVASAIAQNLPERSIQSEWFRLTGTEGAPELVDDSLPDPQLDLPV